MEFELSLSLSLCLCVSVSVCLSVSLSLSVNDQETNSNVPGSLYLCGQLRLFLAMPCPLGSRRSHFGLKSDDFYVFIKTEYCCHVNGLAVWSFSDLANNKRVVLLHPCLSITFFNRRKGSKSTHNCEKAHLKDGAFILHEDLR